jgi:hypothetical protein
VAVLGPVDLIWWLCLRLAFICGRRSDEEIWIGIGWNGADVPGGALCEAWIGLVPAAAEAREGWPVAWTWRASPLEPPGWDGDFPNTDDRAPFEPGSVGVLVPGPDGKARLACWATAWGDRWTAPGFDAARLVRLLRTEIIDAELRAEEEGDEDDEDDQEDEEDPDAPADQEEARAAAIAALVAYAEEIRQRGRVRQEGAPPRGLSDCMHRALAGLTPREREILRQRCPGIPPLAADQRPEDLPDAREEPTTGPVADEDDPDAPAHPDDVWRSPFCTAELPELPDLPPGYAWSRRPLALMLAQGTTWVGRIENDGSGDAHPWKLRWSPSEGGTITSCVSSPIKAARTLAALAWQHETRELVADERPPATCRTGQDPADNRAADLPALPSGYRWEALTDSSAQVMTSAEIGRGSCVAELYPINSSEGVAGWFWSVAAWPGHDGESDVSPTRQEAAGNVARVLRRATTGEG